MSTVWEKVEVDIVHLLFFKGCHYLVIAQNDLLGWLEWCMLDNAIAETVTKFLY